MKKTKILNTDSEQIIAVLQGEQDPEKLSPKLVEKLDRVHTCQSLLIRYKRVHKVVKMMVSRYGYNLATAYRDVNLTTEIFGPAQVVNKDFRRAIAEKMIEEDREYAKIKQDSKALAMSTRNYIDLHNLKGEDTELPDLSSLEWHQNVIMVLPEQVGINPASEEDLLKRADEVIAKIAEDAEYEED